MKKILCLTLIVASILLVGCYKTNVESDYPAAIMVEDIVYLLPFEPSPIEVDDSEIIGYTNSYTDEYPERNGETNFNRELEMPYAKVDGGIAVLYDNEWYVCAPRE